jgi:hypothetical protein
MVFYIQTCFTILKSPILHAFFTIFTYNAYIGPYFLSHVVLRISPVNSPRVLPLYLFLYHRLFFFYVLAIILYVLFSPPKTCIEGHENEGNACMWHMLFVDMHPSGHWKTNLREENESWILCDEIICSGGAFPLIFCIHVRLGPIYWGGYLPCRKDYQVWYFTK